MSSNGDVKAYAFNLIAAFADHMEGMIARNERNAEGPGWLTEQFPIERMIRILRQDVEELEIAVRLDGDVLDKAADVANLAMMIADRYGAITAPKLEVRS